METLQQNRRHSMFFQSVNLGEMVMCLEDLINYFAQPEDDMGLYTPIRLVCCHEAKSNFE